MNIMAPVSKQSGITQAEADEAVRKYLSTVNASGITPTEFNILILPSPTDEKFAGTSIIKPNDTQEKDKFATTDGTLVAISPLAFNYVTDEEWGDDKPKPGMKVIYVKYAGSRRKGKDGVEYVLIKDRDVVATIEE